MLTENHRWSELGWVCSSVVGGFPSMCRALGSALSTAKAKLSLREAQQLHRCWLPNTSCGIPQQVLPTCRDLDSDARRVKVSRQKV